MMWAGIVQAALTTAQGMLDYTSAYNSYKNQKKLQEYNNKMVNLSNALNQNAITANVVQNMQHSALKATRIQMQGAVAMGATSVQAAATGTIGNSVSQANLSARQAEAMSEADREFELETYNTSAMYSRIQSSHAAAMQQDYTPIEKPSFLSHLISTSSKSLSAFMGGGSQGVEGSSSGMSASAVQYSGSTGSKMLDSYAPATRYSWMSLSSLGGTSGF